MNCISPNMLFYKTKPMNIHVYGLYRKNTFSSYVILLTVIIVKKIRTYMDTLHIVTLNYSFFILIFNEVKTLQHRYCNKL